MEDLGCRLWTLGGLLTVGFACFTAGCLLAAAGVALLNRYLPVDLGVDEPDMTEPEEYQP